MAPDACQFVFIINILSDWRTSTLPVSLACVNRLASRPTRADAAVDLLVGRILAGSPPIGGLLPPERELATELRLSRATLREAMRRLEALGLVRSQQGSGTRVADWRREGRFELLPWLVRHAPPGFDLPRFLLTALRLRRQLIVEAVRWLSAASPDAIARVRACLDHAAAQAGDPQRFVAADLEMIRALCEAGGFLPGLWLINRFDAIYPDLAAAMPESATPPDDYAATWRAILEAAAAGRSDQAAALLDDYFDRLDARLLPGVQP